MNKADLLKEYKNRMTAGIESAAAISDPVRVAELIRKLRREVTLIDQQEDKKTFLTAEEFSEYLKNSNGKKLSLITKSGNEIEFMVDAETLSVPQPLENFSKKFNQEELEPAVKNQAGLYLTPPHGELIWQGKKTAIIKSIKLTSHLEEPLYLLSGKFCYGIIKLGIPKAINAREFSALSSKHGVTEAERKKWWPKSEILYYYPVSIVRRWTPPREWKVQPGAQMFVKDVKFEETSNSARFIFEAQEDKSGEGDTREEGIVKEMDLYGDWYKVTAVPGKTYRYVAQHHIRGKSVHTDLRMEVNDHLVGWTLDTPGSTTDPRHDKFLRPVSASQGSNFQNLAERKLIQPKVWLTIKGKIPAGGIGATVNEEAEFKIISTGTVKFGVQKHDFHEYFLYPDKKWSQDSTVKGRWIVALIPRPEHYTKAGEGKNMWAFWKPNDQRPYAEYQDYEESVTKAEKENGYVVWQDPEKGIVKKDIDFREKKKSWIYK